MYKDCLDNLLLLFGRALWLLLWLCVFVIVIKVAGRGSSCRSRMLLLAADDDKDNNNIRNIDVASSSIIQL